MEDATFEKLKAIYRQAGYRLYIVGGTTRDLLLNRSYSDWDFVTDATPSEEKAFLPAADFTFAKYGSVKLHPGTSHEVDLTTLRVEGAYDDFRHPSFIQFVKDPRQDYVRRDFTINALYLDENYHLLDFCGGYADLKAKIIRFVGDPSKRVQEDPLRILRAERFAQVLGFTFEEKTKQAIEENRSLLAKLNPEKVKEERRKLEKAVK
jgi:tRNA nucleotidyltransferase (CCA-adding enzyme)